jgi:hypothetical protein
VAILLFRVLGIGGLLGTEIAVGEAGDPLAQLER